jgi:hypothetical protein
VINLLMQRVIISVIYIHVIFTVPGQVGVLFLEPGSHNISVNWKQPILNSYCVMQYVIYWLNVLNGDNDSRIVPAEDDSFVIGKLEACVEYKVSVTPMNEEGDNSGAVSGNAKTETEGKFQTHYSLLFV